MDRRSFLNRSGMGIGAALVLPAIAGKPVKHPVPDSWSAIRSQFNFDPTKIPMSQMFLVSHPKWIRDAIEKHRVAFDKNPIEYFEQNFMAMDLKARESAAAYINATVDEVALTDSTTMGLGILYTGLKLKPGDEILTTTHDHYSTVKSLDFAASRSQATIKRISLFEKAAAATVDEIVGNLTKAIGPKTRVIAVTWVHSDTGMKLPISDMTQAVKEINTQRGPANRIFFCVDGVHGFGVENIDMAELGCDFFAAGAHKWIFGPRGTGILYGRKDAWDMLAPAIPPFSIAFAVWQGQEPESKVKFGDLHSPGGFHSFEHRWALPEAFDFHLTTGKNKIQERTYYLSTMLKAGLMDMNHVKLHTPLSTRLSAGINCFEVAGLKSEDVVKKLHARNIIANTSPYPTGYARLTPCLINSEEEIRNCLTALGKMKV